MRKLVLGLLVALTLWAQPASAATWTFVNKVTAGSSNNQTVTTGTVDMTVSGGADTFFVWCANYDARAACVISDSTSANTYTALTRRRFATDTTGEWFYAKNVTTSATQTFSVAAGSGGGLDHYPTIVVYGFKGGDLSAPFDATAGENGNNVASTTTITMGAAVTPTNGNELVLAGLASGVASTLPTITSGSYGSVDYVNFSAGLHYLVGTAYWIQTTATASNPTWTVGTVGNLVMSVAAFIPATGGGGPPGCKNGLLLSGAGCH